MRASCFNHWKEVRFETETETDRVPGSELSISAAPLTQCRTEPDRDHNPLTSKTGTTQKEKLSR